MLPTTTAGLAGRRARSGPSPSGCPGANLAEGGWPRGRCAPGVVLGMLEPLAQGRRGWPTAQGPGAPGLAARTAQRFRITPEGQGPGWRFALPHPDCHYFPPTTVPPGPRWRCAVRRWLTVRPGRCPGTDAELAVGAGRRRARDLAGHGPLPAPGHSCRPGCGPWRCPHWPGGARGGRTARQSAHRRRVCTRWLTEAAGRAEQEAALLPAARRRRAGRPGTRSGGSTSPPAPHRSRTGKRKYSASGDERPGPRQWSRCSPTWPSSGFHELGTSRPDHLGSPDQPVTGPTGTGPVARGARRGSRARRRPRGPVAWPEALRDCRPAPHAPLGRTPNGGGPWCTPPRSVCSTSSGDPDKPRARRERAVDDDPNSRLGAPYIYYHQARFPAPEVRRREIMVSFALAGPAVHADDRLAERRQRDGEIRSPRPPPDPPLRPDHPRSATATVGRQQARWSLAGPAQPAGAETCWSGSRSSPAGGGPERHRRDPSDPCAFEPRQPAGPAPPVAIAKTFPPFGPPATNPRLA